MNKTFGLLTAFGISLCAAFSSDAANVLYNSDFEASPTDSRGWTLTAGTTSYDVVADDPGGSGSSVEGVEPPPGGSLGRLLQEVNAKVVPGGTYRLTGWIKANGVSSAGGAVIGVGTVNADGALVSGSFSSEVGHVTGATGWLFFDSGDFTLPSIPAGSVSYAVYLDFNGTGGASARFDDILLDGPFATPPNSIWVDFAHTGVRAGTQALPLVRVVEAAHSVAADGDVKLATGQTAETLIVSRALRLVNVTPGNGSVIIGRLPTRQLQRAQTGFVSATKR